MIRRASAPAGSTVVRPAGEDAQPPTASALLGQVVPRPVLATCLTVLRRLGGSTWTDVAVTSTRAREGRSTVALGTAWLAARRLPGATVVVDLDLAAPSLATLLHLPPAPGLAEVLRGEVDLADAVSWLDPALGVLPAGRVDAEACALAEGVDMAKVLTRFAEAGQRVVADLPPLPPHGDANLLADHFSATILVVRAGVARADEVRASARMLPDQPAVVLNGTSSAVPRWLRLFRL